MQYIYIHMPCHVVLYGYVLHVSHLSKLMGMFTCLTSSTFCSQSTADDTRTHCMKGQGKVYSLLLQLIIKQLLCVCVCVCVCVRVCVCAGV